jgi:hypothetical protein
MRKASFKTDIGKSRNVVALVSSQNQSLPAAACFSRPSPAAPHFPCFFCEAAIMVQQGNVRLAQTFLQFQPSTPQSS